jgi:hypothetical protein
MGFPPDRHSFLEIKMIAVGMAIVLGPNIQKFINIVIGDEIL